MYRDPMTMDQAVERMESYAKLEFDNEGDVYFLAIQPKHTQELAGEILFKRGSVRGKQGEIGWSLHPDSVGNGYVTEAAHALLKYGFEHFGFHRVCARIDAENVASVNIAERLGMRREAHLMETDYFNDRWGDECVCTQCSQLILFITKVRARRLARCATPRETSGFRTIHSLLTRF